MVRVLMLIGWLLGMQGRARAETVALLPLDGEQRLEIYGQPVAAEIARVLVAAGLDVVVVGAKMAVPHRAQLVVDGTIKAGAGDAVTLTMRIRDPRHGTVLETLPAAATTLANIDRAAAELSARVLPAVKAHLEALHRSAIDKPPVEVGTRPPAPERPNATLLAAVTTAPGGGARGDVLRVALEASLAGWAREHQRDAKLVAPASLGRDVAAKSVTGAGSDLAISCDVLTFHVDPGAVPLARARVRVTIADATGVQFERVVRTDTIVGDRGMPPEELAGRVAREVFSIVHPHVRRHVATWR